MTTDKTYIKAQKRAKDKVEFYYHIVTYIAVMTLLTIIYLVSGSGYFWVIWPMMGWGIGLFFHGLKVFVFSENSSFTKNMIDREMKNQRWEEDEIV